jgi:ABC-2 type transport system permease protein/lipopolysaccharide transport system permease protein
MTAIRNTVASDTLDTSRVSARPGRNQFELAIKDIRNGIVFAPLWLRLGWNDILQRYRRSLLGPLWLTASMAIMVLSLGVVQTRIFKVDARDFIPFLCVGLLVWGYIASILTEAGTMFTGAEAYVKQIRLPYSVYIYRFTWSKLIIFAHNFVIYLGILIYFSINPGWTVLYVVPGFLLLVLNGVFTSLYVGMASARFRDIPQIINSLIQVLFFITPIFWKPELIGLDSYLIAFNPFYHFVEIVRAPLLGASVSGETYLVVTLITILNGMLALAFFVRFRSRIAYWV